MKKDSSLIRPKAGLRERGSESCHLSSKIRRKKNDTEESGRVGSCRLAAYCITAQDGKVPAVIVPLYSPDLL